MIFAVIVSLAMTLLGVSGVLRYTRVIRIRKRNYRYVSVFIVFLLGLSILLLGVGVAMGTGLVTHLLLS